MVTISFAESSRQIDELIEAAEAAALTGPVDGAVAAWRRVLDHSCAHHQVIDYEILDEIHRLLRAAGRYVEAIEAKWEAVAAGYSSEPDPEADIAECLLAAGRRVEAQRLYAELRARDSDDVWLNNSAAYAYSCSHGINARTKRITKSLHGTTLHIAPLTVDGLVSYGTQHAEDPGAAGSRSGFAAELLRRGGAIRWPPGRSLLEDQAVSRASRARARCRSGCSRRLSTPP